MTDRTSDCKEPATSGPKPRSAQCVVLGAICVLVIGGYASIAKSGWLELWSLNAENTYYNLLVQGFRTGQLNLKREVPPGLTQLADPYDPKANSSYLWVEQPLVDLSYYQGKLYLYFGVTPALALFWPYAALTGHCLLHKDAVVIFFSVGFLASVGLVWAVWRRYFAEVSVGVMAAAALALGAASFTLAILQRCDVYEVAISCGYAFTMVALMLLWQAMHAARGRAWWLAGASLAYGLAVGARPSLLLGAVILLVPVARAWRGKAEPGQRRPIWALLLAATLPITLIGMGLMLYNTLRFDNPLEFGQRYQLNGNRWGAIQQFDLRYFWYNFRVGFWAPAQWSRHFPYVQDLALPSLPERGTVEQPPSGVLTNVPLVWLALGALLAWRNRSGEARSGLRWFLVAVAVLFGTSALVLFPHSSMTLRYQLEFLAPLVLLAMIGILGIEGALLAGRPPWWRAARWVWVMLLAFSVSFNLLVMLERSVQTIGHFGVSALQTGRVDEAIVQFQKALRLQPAFVGAHYNLGIALAQAGRMPEAVRHLEEAVRLKPDFTEAHLSLGTALLQLGKGAEAASHLEQALRLNPDSADAHNHLGVALVGQGKLSEAAAHYEQALRVKPDFADAHYNLGNALVRQNQTSAAISHYEQAVRIAPENIKALNNLANVLFQQGRLPEAIGHYEQALLLQPDYADARGNLGLALNNLAWILATETNGAIRNVEAAVRRAERACELTTNSVASYLDTLGVAYSEAGRFSEAIVTAKQARELAIKTGQQELAEQAESRIRLYESGRPYHEASAPKR